MIGSWLEVLSIISRIEVPDYESMEREEWKQNAQQVKQGLANNDPRLAKRIATYIDRFGYDESTVRKKIRDDPMFAAHFAKEPRRTSLHQKAAAKWLDMLPSVTQFRSLPPSGKKALYITSDGEIQSGEILKHGKPSKSLDFMWLTGSIICYAMHKYTKEGGGNQDSQYKEMLALLKNFLSCGEEGIILIIIVDGPYYTENKMNELRKNTRDHPPRSYAVHLEEIPNISDEYINWEDLRDD